MDYIYIVSQLVGEQSHRLFTIRLDNNEHVVGDEFASILTERYGEDCKLVSTSGPLTATVVDVVYSNGRKEKYELSAIVFYDRRT